MYTNFQHKRVSNQSKPRTQIYLQIFGRCIKLQLAIRFSKSRLSDMHYPITDIQAEFKTNQAIRYQFTAIRYYFHRRQTDGQTDGQTDNSTTIIGSFFEQLLKTQRKFDLNAFYGIK